MVANLLSQAESLMQATNWDQAIPLLEQAQKMAPQNIPVLDKLGFCYSQNHRYSDAIQIYQQLCSLQPEVAKWPYAQGYQYYAQMDYEKAIVYFDHALMIKPDYIVVLYRKGYAISQLEQLQNFKAKALNELEKCRRAYNKMPEGNEKQREQKHYADACFQQGKLLDDLGNHQLAEQRFLEALQFIKDDADIYYNLGKAYVTLKHFQEALNYLQIANQIAGKPLHYILDYMGRAYLGLGNFNAALQVYKSMPPDIQNRPYILRNMGEVYIALQQWEPAEAVLEEAVRVDRKNHNGHYHLGVVYEKLEKIPQAMKEFQRAIDLRKGVYNISFPDAENALDALKAAYPQITSLKSSVVFPVASAPDRVVGRVIKFIEDRGFGFLEVPGRDNGLFFHIKEVKGQNLINLGQFFEFSIRDGNKGPEAYDLRLVQSAQTPD